MNQLRIVKILVFILTTMLIFGFVMLFQTIAQPPAKSFSISVSEPTGSEIKQIHADSQKVYILIKGGGMPDRIKAFNHHNGKEIFNLNIKWSENE